jgi:predicted MPP superfamily phosphohydrolase
MQPPKHDPARSTRRRWLRTASLAALGGSVGLGTYSFGIEPHWLHTVQRTLPIPKLPDSWIGTRLAQISDLHIGKVVDDDYMARALRTVSHLNSDLVVITGDIMQCHDRDQSDQVARLFEKNLQLGRRGTIAILGNHDYGGGWKDDALATGLARKLRGLGIVVLRHQSVSIDGLSIVGLDDLWGSRWNEAQAEHLIATAQPQLVLVHNPDVCDKPIWVDYQGWILAGHTHGGQCRVPSLGPPFIPVRNKRYTAGPFDLTNGRWLYINPGVGYTHRVRFMVRPEITLFDLVNHPREELI